MSQKNMFLVFSLIFVIMVSAAGFSIAYAEPAKADNKISLTTGVSGVDVREVIALISRASNISVICDRTIVGRIKLQVKDMQPEALLRAVAESTNSGLEKIGDVYVIGYSHNMSKVKDSMAQAPAAPANSPASAFVTLVSHDKDITEVINLIAKANNLNVIYGREAVGKISVSLHNVHYENAIRLIAEVNGLTVKKSGDIYMIVYHPRKDREKEKEKDLDKEKGQDQEKENKATVEMKK